MQQFVNAAGLWLGNGWIVDGLLVCLPQLLGFHVALLLVPDVSLLLHPLSNLLIDVHISTASSELCLHSLMSLKAQEIQHLLYIPGRSTSRACRQHHQLGSSTEQWRAAKCARQARKRNLEN